MSGGGAASRNKYFAKRCPCDLGGTPHTHDSLGERRRCWVLHQRQAAGEITDLVIHPSYPLSVNGVRVGLMTLDFGYTEQGRPVVEDFKSRPTRTGEAYRLRRRVFEACHAPLAITEVE